MFFKNSIADEKTRLQVKTLSLQLKNLRYEFDRYKTLLGEDAVGTLWAWAAACRPASFNDRIHKNTQYIKDLHDRLERIEGMLARLTRSLQEEVKENYEIAPKETE